MTIGWGIIGIGRHADNLMAPAINGAKNARLVAVYSRDQGRADDFARRHGVGKGYTSLEQMLRHPGLDAVYIGSPNALHRPQTEACARAGKHVLCDKPMALTEEDCRAMIRACKESGVKLGVGFHLRHHPGHVEARRVISTGALGDVVLLQGQWASGVRGGGEPSPQEGLRAWWRDPDLVGGGAMMGTGVHVIDLLRFLTGQEVVEVVALTDGQQPEQPLERMAQVLLRFGGGAVASIVASRLVPDSRNDVVVYGTLGRIFGRGTLLSHPGNYPAQRQGVIDIDTETVKGLTTHEQEDMYIREAEAFGRSIAEGREPNASGLDGLRVCQVTSAAFRSAREGRRVSLVPAQP